MKTGGAKSRLCGGGRQCCLASLRGKKKTCGRQKSNVWEHCRDKKSRCHATLKRYEADAVDLTLPTLS